MVKIRKNNGMTSEWIIVPAPVNILSTALVIWHLFYRYKDTYNLSNSPKFRISSLNSDISHFTLIPTTKLSQFACPTVILHIKIENEQNKMGMLLLIAMTIMAWLIRKVRRTIIDKGQN